MRAAILLTAMTVWLSGCCGEGQCDGPDGESCRSGFDCRGQCVNGFCRDLCSANDTCEVGRVCWRDDSSTALCLPPPEADERWGLRVDALFNATGRPNELTEPDDFVCLGVGDVTLCSEEQSGVDVTFSREFSTVFTTLELSNVSISVFDSNDVFAFGGCEGSCSVLSRVDRQLVHGEAVDARPLASRKDQLWDIPTSAGMTIRFSVLAR